MMQVTPRPNPLWTFAGLLSLGLGFIGIFLPLLPTTPLVLLAAFCFGRGSPRLRAWLDRHPRWGPVIHDWQENGAIPRSGKRVAVLAMTVAFTFSVALGLGVWILAIQAVCLLGAGAFVLTRPDA